ncbi:MAG: DUF3105 domain-containing protein [Actinomycetota bacterium]
MKEAFARPAASTDRDRKPVSHASAVRVAVALLGLAALLVACGGEKAPEGTRSFRDLSRQHVDSPVTDPQDPPVGGPHFSAWQNCASTAIRRSENAVHSMEHGAVWLTYRPDLSSADQATLRKLARRYVLVGRLPVGLKDPVVASAWGRQLRLSSVDDPRLAEFVGAFVQGPQTPERGAPCTGGTGEPAR